MTLRDFHRHIGEMKHYIIAAAGTFLIGIYLGYAESDQFLFFLQGQTERLREIAEGIGGMGNSTWKLLAFIFMNNILVSLVMVYSGAFFGLMPLFSLLSNGLLVGFLAERTVPDIGWSKFLLSIVPHGIIEIPAVILACAYGLKFGMLMTKTLLFLPSVSRRASNGRQLLQLLKLTLPLSIVLCGLLLAAALIESLVTPVLAG